jgi:hypothetical protein
VFCDRVEDVLVNTLGKEQLDGVRQALALRKLAEKSPPAAPEALA